MVKNLPAMQETGVQSLGLENPLEKGMANHSSILAWRTPWTVAHQALPSMGFPSQEYWSGLLFLTPGDHPDPGIKPASPAEAGGFFTTSATWKPHDYHMTQQSQYSAYTLRKP